MIMLRIVAVEFCHYVSLCSDINFENFKGVFYERFSVSPGFNNGELS